MDSPRFKPYSPEIIAKVASLINRDRASISSRMAARREDNSVIP
jgi:hypothetical protein